MEISKEQLEKHKLWVESEGEKGEKLVTAWGANLTNADLTDADLTDANLEAIENDLYRVLDANPNEVKKVKKLLMQGKINGSCYEGECACLVGSIANIRKVNHESLNPNGSSPIEKWFLAIGDGHTPKNNQISKITNKWFLKWLKNNKELLQVIK